MRKTIISLHPRLGLSILLPHLETSLVGKEKESWSYGLWNQIVRENVKETLLVKIPNGTMRLSPSVICSIATILIWIYDTYQLLFQYYKHIVIVVINTNKYIVPGRQICWKSQELCIAEYYWSSDPETTIETKYYRSTSLIWRRKKSLSCNYPPPYPITLLGKVHLTS